MRKHVVWLAILFAAALLIFFFRSFSPVTNLTSFIQSIFAGPRVGIYGFKTAIAGGESEEVARLKKENRELTQKLVDYQKTVKDNEALRSQFETLQTQSFKMVPAKVLGFLGPFTDPTNLVINAGSKSGVKRGMAVVSGVNLVGKIDLVAENYSRVVLPSNESFTEVVKTSENGSLGVVHGERDFILLSRVSVKDKLSEKETVLTRGGGDLGNLVPEGIVVGSIASVYKNESMPYQTAKIDGPVNTVKLQTVFIIVGI